MTKEEKQVINDWEIKTDIIAKTFILKYFGKADFEKGYIDYWWVSDDCGGVMFINDYFFSLDDMIDFIKNNYSKKDMFDYYDLRLDFDSYIGKKKREPVPNIKNWKKLKKENLNKKLK